MKHSNGMENIRRYDLDWLRVIVFALLIFYHVGMFFVPWSWHLKNNVTYDWLKWPMLFLNQWRLPILFVISGMGTAYAFSFRSGAQFVGERFIRLGIPFVFGMFVIVTPQVYFERMAQGAFSGTYWDFILGPAFTNGTYPKGNITWNHLWFLPYLLIFSVLLMPVFSWLCNHPKNRWLNGWRERLIKAPLSIYLLVIPLFLYESLMEPFFNITHNLVWDWFNFTSSLTLFFYGFLLVSLKNVFWETLAMIKKITLAIGVVTFSALLCIWIFFEDTTLVHFTEAFFKVTNFWSWILTIFGFAAQYLNKQSKVLSYCNKAVYPFYILHQTVTVALAFYIRDLSWGLFPKFSFLVVATFGVSALLYEGLIKRVRLLRPLFGLKS